MEKGQLLASLKPKFGSDFSEKLINEVKITHKKLNFIQADIEKLPKVIGKIRFDFVIICDTIGYLEDISKALDQLHRFFDEDTRLIVSYYSPLWTHF